LVNNKEKGRKKKMTVDLAVKGKKIKKSCLVPWGWGENIL
jgi:hypothetical protein